MELSNLQIKTFQKGTSKRKKKSTLKKILTFREMELCTPKLEKFICHSYFRRELAQPEKEILILL